MEVADDEAAANPEVQQRVAVAGDALAATAKKVLMRLLECVDQVPYGIRWVCKQLQTIAGSTFTAATTQQIRSLIGGFVFLRYINPAVVTPDGNGLVTKKPTPTQRRNLILLAKVLQVVSNKH